LLAAAEVVVLATKASKTNKRLAVVVLNQEELQETILA
jgi:hypothetical protein